MHGWLLEFAAGGRAAERRQGGGAAERCSPPHLYSIVNASCEQAATSSYSTRKRTQAPHVSPDLAPRPAAAMSLPRTSRALQSAIEDDQRRQVRRAPRAHTARAGRWTPLKTRPPFSRPQAVDAAKKRAVSQHVDYDTFKNMVWGGRSIAGAGAGAAQRSSTRRSAAARCCCIITVLRSGLAPLTHRSSPRTSSLSRRRAPPSQVRARCHAVLSAAASACGALGACQTMPAQASNGAAS